MYTSTILFLSTAIGAMAIPMPKSGNVLTSGTFSVEANANPNFKPNGPAALRKVLTKYNLLDKYPLALPALQRRQDGSVAANPADQDVQYTCPVTIGKTTLNLDFDTGSADLWVFSSELSKADQKGHTIYTPSDSDTYKKMDGASWKISYGDGSSASGDVGTDTVTVGTTVVKSQAVELASTVASSFVTDTASDGLLGLAFGSINTVKPTKAKTFFENAASSLKANLFTADLKHNTKGSYDFGYIDNSKHTDSVQYVPVDNSNGFWEFSAPSYKIGSGNGTVRVASDDGTTAIADTGTTLLLVGTAMAKKYYAGVKSAKLDSTQGGYTFDCSETLPSIALSLGDKFSTVPGSLINYAPISDGSSTCFGGLQGYDGTQWIYGDIFLKSVLAVFDYGNTQFGFAPKSS